VLGNQDEISLNGVWLELHAFVSLGRGGFKDGCVMVRLQDMGLDHRDGNLEESALLHIVGVISTNSGII